MIDVTPLAARSLSGLLEQSTGQQLVVGRRWRIETALQPVMRAHGIASLDHLAGMACQPAAHELRDEVVEALLNHETSFFRDLALFRSLDAHGLETVARRRAVQKRLRIWSAGCSTGQEAYSVALLFAAKPDRWAGWTIDIMGTDVSPAAIAQAREGLYSQFEVQRGLPIRELLARFDPEGETWRIKPALRSRVIFSVHNLLDRPPEGVFDIILCRNVLLYFSAERRAAVFDRLASAMAEDGLLMLGAGETILDQSAAFTPDPDLRGLYRRTGHA
jgi:chemotaxis protein methyltransferase CheR